MVLGAFNVLDGLMLVRRSAAYPDAQFHIANADMWGWILIGFALLQLVAGIKLWSSTGEGKVFALVLASLGMVLWFGLIFAMPFAAIVGTAINFSIIASVLST